MKKQNNRYRSGNNSGYTLNYKFDSVSIAGKINGTALDLIRKYNDLAKEQQSYGNYVEMEVYRQYAEHYRKIVTEINERRQNRYDNSNRVEGNVSEENEETEGNTTESASENTNVSEPVEAVAEANGYVETLPANDTPVKSFQVVEVSEEPEAANEEVKPKRVVRRRRTTVKKAEEA